MFKKTIEQSIIKANRATVSILSKEEKINEQTS